MTVKYREGNLNPSGYLECTLGELLCNRFPKAESLIEMIISQDGLGYDTLLMSGEDILELLEVPFELTTKRTVVKDLLTLYRKCSSYTNKQISSKTVRAQTSTLAYLYLTAGHEEIYEELDELCDIPFF